MTGGTPVFRGSRDGLISAHYRAWIPDDDAEPSSDLFDRRPASGKPVEIRREDGSILVLDSD